MSALRHPPPSGIGLCIGVSGHRGPPKLPKQSEQPLRALLGRMFVAILATARNVEGAAHLASRFVIVSSLAEGADRIVAEAGLAAGFGLEAILPFARAEYARDFATAESRVSFEQLLARATAVVELDGATDERPRAYEAAGLFMLAKIDLLIAIWDGREAAGVGGTAQIVNRAIADGIPVVWIEPTNPGAMLISQPPAGDTELANAKARPKESFRPAELATLTRLVEEMIMPAIPR